MDKNKQHVNGHIRRYIHGIAISIMCIPFMACAAIFLGIGFLCLGLCVFFIMLAAFLGKLTALIYHSRLAPTAKTGENLFNPVARAEQAIIDKIKSFGF